MFHWVLNPSPIIVSEYVSVFFYYFLHFESIKFRISCSQMSFKIDGFKNFAIFTEKRPVLESLCNKVAGLYACKFIKKRLQHKCFLIDIAKLLYRTPSVAAF